MPIEVGLLDAVVVDALRWGVIVAGVFADGGAAARPVNGGNAGEALAIGRFLHSKIIVVGFRCCCPIEMNNISCKPSFKIKPLHRKHSDGAADFPTAAQRGTIGDGSDAAHRVAAVDGYASANGERAVYCYIAASASHGEVAAHAHTCSAVYHKNNCARNASIPCDSERTARPDKYIRVATKTHVAANGQVMDYFEGVVSGNGTRGT